MFHSSGIAPKDIPLFPTQLTESILNFAACILLILYSIPPRKKGSITGIYIIYYSLMRFVLEFFRGDMERGLFLHISTSQWISLALLPLGFYLLLYKVRKIAGADIPAT
jgi:phosphatidylglycerol:prolipoprotein diacylglycerol transferase